MLQQRPQQPPMPPGNQPIYRLTTYRDKGGRTLELHEVVHSGGSTAEEHAVGATHFMGVIMLHAAMPGQPPMQMPLAFRIDVPSVRDAFDIFDEEAAKAVADRQQQMKDEHRRRQTGLILPG